MLQWVVALVSLVALAGSNGAYLWCYYNNTVLKTYSSGTRSYKDVTTAKSECLQRSDCFGVTKERSGIYTLRRDWDLKGGHSGTVSYVPCGGYFKCLTFGLKCASGKFLSVQPDGTVECNSDSYGQNERIIFNQWGKSSGFIKSKHGKYLSATNKDKLEWDAVHRRSWEKFTLTQDQDKVAFQSFHGKYISGRPDGSVHVDSITTGSSEWFTVHPQACLNNVNCDCSKEILADDYELLEMKYHQQGSAATTFRPERIGYQHIDNRDSSVEQSTKFSVSESVTETTSFTHTAGASVKVGTEFSSGIPCLAAGKISVEVTASYKFAAGTKRSETKKMQAD